MIPSSLSQGPSCGKRGAHRCAVDGAQWIETNASKISNRKNWGGETSQSREFDSSSLQSGQLQIVSTCFRQLQIVSACFSSILDGL